MATLLTVLLILAAVIFLTLRCYTFLSGKRLILDFLHWRKLNSTSIQIWDNFCVNNTNRSSIVISLSTIPSRIAQLEPTLKSLLAQTTRPAKIHLYIPEYSEREQCSYEIPDFLGSLKCLEIIKVNRDWGPATKFIPAIQTLPADQHILVVDDDNIYPDNLLFTFEKASRKKPDWILAASGWRVPEDLVDRPTTLWSNIMKTPPTPVTSTRVSDFYEVDVIQGYSGYLLQPRFFNVNELTNYSAVPEAARYVDDVWISAHAQVRKYVIPAKRYCYTLYGKRSHYKNTSLAKINNHGKEKHEDRNNSVMISFFKNKWSKTKRE